MATARSFTRTLGPALLGLTLICLAAADAGAQQLRPGDRIRVRTMSGGPAEMVGTYQGSEPDHLVLFTSQSTRVEVPWDNLSRLELSRGMQTNAGKGALIGLGVGGAAGLALGLAFVADDSGFYEDVNAGHVVFATLVFGAAGAGLGALIGLASKSERWQTVPAEQWRIQVAPDLKGGVTIGVNLRL
jgi:hypothetical protein